MRRLLEIVGDGVEKLSKVAAFDGESSLRRFHEKEGVFDDRKTVKGREDFLGELFELDFVAIGSDKLFDSLGFLEKEFLERRSQGWVGTDAGHHLFVEKGLREDDFGE